MALSGSRLTGTLHPDIKNQLQTIFGPQIPAGATPTQTSNIQDIWDKMAQAIANATGPDVVTEITANAVVEPGTLAITPADIQDGMHTPCTGNGAVNVGTGTVT